MDKMSCVIRLRLLSSGIIASELGEMQLLPNAGIPHDIGKAIDREVEGSHVEIGTSARKPKRTPSCGEYHCQPPRRWKPKASLQWSPAADVWVQRPGARRVSESYTALSPWRGSKTPSGNSFCFFKQWREIRIMVNPGQIKDDKVNLGSQSSWENWK